MVRAEEKHVTLTHTGVNVNPYEVHANSYVGSHNSQHTAPTMCTNTHACAHTHCVEYIPYPMPPGGCPQTCEIVVLGGATHSCLLALQGTPARHRGVEGRGREGRGEGGEWEGSGKGVERRGEEGAREGRDRGRGSGGEGRGGGVGSGR